MEKDRMPPIPYDKMTSSQKAASEEFEKVRGVPLFGPFVPLVRSPKLLSAANNFGVFARYDSILPPKISELIILITAREWTQQVEWAIHEPIALKNGISTETVSAIANGERPKNMDTVTEAVWEFSVEIQKFKKVKDETYEKALEVFGEEGVMDILGINGYYTFLAMVMNAARTERPESSASPLKPI